MVSYYIGLSLLSNNQSKGVTRELLSAEGRRILSLLEGRPLTEDDIIKDENGRPFFKDHRGDFSISHSGNMAAVSFVRDGALRSGCDVQLIKARTNTLKIAERFYSAPEREYVMADETRFFEIWTLKECFLKLKGLSVFDMETAPSFVGNDGRLHCTFDAAVFHLYELSCCNGSGERYLLAVAIEGDRRLEPAIQWFSRSFLPHRSLIDNVPGQQIP